MIIFRLRDRFRAQAHTMRNLVVRYGPRMCVAAVWGSCLCGVGADARERGENARVTPLYALHEAPSLRWNPRAPSGGLPSPVARALRKRAALLRDDLVPSVRLSSSYLDESKQ